jgi:hypothetical protein
MEYDGEKLNCGTNLAMKLAMVDGIACNIESGQFRFKVATNSSTASSLPLEVPSSESFLPVIALSNR